MALDAQTIDQLINLARTLRAYGLFDPESDNVPIITIGTPRYGQVTCYLRPGEAVAIIDHLIPECENVCDSFGFDVVCQDKRGHDGLHKFVEVDSSEGAKVEVTW